MSLQTRPTNGRFWEPSTVAQYSEQWPVLEALDAIRVGPETTLALVDALCTLRGLPPVPVRFSGTDQSGQRAKYWGRPDGFTLIRFAPWPRAESVAHELAHHWLWMDILRNMRPGYRRRPAIRHGWDFTWRLDELGVAATGWLREQGADL